MSTCQIDWKKLLESQSKLDSYVFKLKNLDYSSTKVFRKLALMIELSELANETKVFKFWSVKQMDKHKALDEYADVLHFILSQFLASKLDPTSIYYPSPIVRSKQQFSEDFLDLISSLSVSLDSDDFKNWVFKFFQLGANLNFSLSEVIDAYHHKHQINVQRQAEGY